MATRYYSTSLKRVLTDEEARLMGHTGRTHEPTPAELAVNFTGAMARWIQAGVPVVTQAVYYAREAACEPCELWDAAARFGLGKCMAPGCGCTKFKRWLATEQCKHPQGSKWSALEPAKRGAQGQIPGGQQATTAPVLEPAKRAVP